MQENTKNRILRIGAEIMHLKGYNHTGIQEILHSADIPKGSFYNYFKSKEDFGLQVIDFFTDYFNGFTSGILNNKSLSPVEKIQAILEGFIEFFKSKDFTYGCPIGNIAQEMGDLSPAFRKKLKSAIDSMTDMYFKLLIAAHRTGEVNASIDLKDTAEFLVSSWHGALIHMKVQKSPKPLEHHLEFVLNHILKS